MLVEAAPRSMTLGRFAVQRVVISGVGSRGSVRSITRGVTAVISPRNRSGKLLGARFKSVSTGFLGLPQRHQYGVGKACPETSWIRSRPLSSESASEQTPLERELAMRIRLRGPISVADYMTAALTDPSYGYYTTHSEVFGESGDFVTSPELSQLYGELVGAWAVSVRTDAGLFLIVWLCLVFLTAFPSAMGDAGKSQPR